MSQPTVSLQRDGNVGDQEAREFFENAFSGEDCQEGVAPFFVKRAPKGTWD